MTSCPPPYTIPCRDPEIDCGKFIKNTQEPASKAVCDQGFCSHDCMKQYDGDMGSVGPDPWQNWCGTDNNGEPWGSICIIDRPFEPGEIPVQCRLPAQNYECPDGWIKYLWNNGRASDTKVCFDPDSQINCFPPWGALPTNCDKPLRCTITPPPA